MRKVFSLLIVVLALPATLLAGEGNIGPVAIEHLTIIAVPAGGHIAGNMEVKIKGGFALPTGVSCDTNYITTKKTTDPDRAMFNMLLKVQTTSQPIQLRITDNPAYTAYPGRCSLQWVDLQ